jgi:hypothetical protein
MHAGGGDIQTEAIGSRPLYQLTADQQEVFVTKRRLVHSERSRVDIATQLAAERRAASLLQATLAKSESAVCIVHFALSMSLDFAGSIGGCGYNLKLGFPQFHMTRRLTLRKPPEQRGAGTVASHISSVPCFDASMPG